MIAIDDAVFILQKANVTWMGAAHEQRLAYVAHWRWVSSYSVARRLDGPFVLNSLN